MYTTIAHYIDPIEAHLARGRLLSEGIDAHLGDEHLVVANWEWRLAVGGVKLRVADKDVERANAVLRAIDAGDYALVDDMHSDDMHSDDLHSDGMQRDGTGSGDTRALHPPDRESRSSRLAWLALMLLGIPLPWRRRAASDDEAVREV